MTFVAGAVIWSGYLLSWWGWLALTSRVPPGEANTFWWPSVVDLVSPGRIGQAVPPKVVASTAGVLPGTPVDAQGNATGPATQTLRPGQVDPAYTLEAPKPT